MYVHSLWTVGVLWPTGRQACCVYVGIRQVSPGQGHINILYMHVGLGGSVGKRLGYDVGLCSEAKPSWTVVRH